MRPLPAFLGVAVLTLILVACSGDQPATAPSTTPNFLRSSGAYTFSLTCNNAGSNTVANVSIHVTATIIGHLAPLNCGGSDAGITGFTSFDYDISVTDLANTPKVVCTNTRPIHNTRPITCGTNPSATLTITPS